MCKVLCSIFFCQNRWYFLKSWVWKQIFSIVKQVFLHTGFNAIGMVGPREKSVTFGLVGISLSIVQFTQKSFSFQMLSLLLKSKLFCISMTSSTLKPQKTAKLVHSLVVLLTSMNMYSTVNAKMMLTPLISRSLITAQCSQNAMW